MINGLQRTPVSGFFATNSVMRWQAINQGNICVQQNNVLNNSTVPEVRQMLAENPSLSKQIMFYGSSSRGT